MSDVPISERFSSSTAFSVQHLGGGVTVARFAAEGSTESLHEVCDLFPAADADGDTRVLVLCGHPHGFYPLPTLEQIHAVRSDVDRVRQQLVLARRLVHNIMRCETIVVAAVEGPAVGAGAQLALFADIVIAAESAWFKDTHVGIGVTAGDGACLIWPLLLGLGRARLHLLTGKRLTARAAFEAGAIAEVAPDGTAEHVGIEHARWLAGRPAFALASTKMALNQWLLQAAPGAMDFSWALELASQFLPDSTSHLQRAMRPRAEEMGER